MLRGRNSRSEKGHLDSVVRIQETMEPHPGLDGPVSLPATSQSGAYLTSPLSSASSAIIFRAVKVSSLTRLHKGEGDQEPLSSPALTPPLRVTVTPLTSGSR